MGGNDKKNIGDGGEGANEECLESEFIEDVIGADELPKDYFMVCFVFIFVSFWFSFSFDTCFNIFYLQFDKKLSDNTGGSTNLIYYTVKRAVCW